MNTRTLSGLLLLAATTASTDAGADYTVQIGAYAKPELADVKAATRVAEVHKVKGSSGLTRILVGRFRTSEGARAALERLRSSGYHDAFIAKSGAGTQSHFVTPPASQTSTRSVSDIPWGDLDEDLRKKLVLLDGRPYIKDGDTFTPLDRYSQQ